MMKARGYLNDFVDLMIRFNERGIDTTVVATKVIERVSTMYKCSHGKEIGHTNRGVLTLMSSFFLYITRMSTSDDYSDDFVLKNDDYCDATLNHNSIITELVALIKSLDDNQESFRKDLSLQLLILMIVGSLAICAWNVIPLVTDVYLFIRQIKKVQKLFINLDKHTRENATKKIMRTVDSDD